MYVVARHVESVDHEILPDVCESKSSKCNRKYKSWLHLHFRHDPRPMVAKKDNSVLLITIFTLMLFQLEMFRLETTRLEMLRLAEWNGPSRPP